MFSSFKEKLSEKLKSFSDGYTPQDGLDKQLADLVDRATSDLLIAADWGLNMELVDTINRNPQICNEKALRQLKRVVVKPNAKIQLLTLTLLESCVKNCSPAFHTELAGSEMWAEMLRLAGDTSIGRVDGEVRDKILGMVEDFAKGLKPPQFMQAYEDLLDRGVDFPVRAAEDQVPIFTPPSMFPDLPPPEALPTATEAAPEDLLAGVSAEDRAAIQAAVAEMEAEERAAREAREAVRATEEAQQQHLQQLQQQQLLLATAAGAAAQQLPPVPEESEQEEAPTDGPEQMQSLLEMAANTTQLLNEMLASVPEAEPAAVREPYIAEVADQCVRIRSRLEHALASLADEALMAQALQQHEDLNNILTRYEELLVKAQAAAPVWTAPQAPAYQAPQPMHSAFEAAQPSQPTPPLPVSQQAAAVASQLKSKFTDAMASLADRMERLRPSHASSTPAAPSGYLPPTPMPTPATQMSYPAAAATASGAQFTLLDEGEDDQESALLTRRTAGPAAAPVPEGPNLINLDDDDDDESGALLPPPSTAAQEPALPARDSQETAQHAANDKLVEVLDRLVMNDVSGTTTPLGQEPGERRLLAGDGVSPPEEKQ